MALFAQLTFSGGTVYVWSGAGSVTWNGHTWSGIGGFLGLPDIGDNSSIEARGVSISLSGFDPTLLADVMSEFQLGLPMAVYIGFYVSGSLYATPLSAWYGNTDQPTVRIENDVATITINGENEIVDISTPADRRYTQQDQQMDWPQDTGMNFVLSLQGVTTFWLSYPNNSNNV